MTATATARRTRPPAPDDGRQRAAAAAEVFLAALQQAIAQLPARPDLDAPTEALREALEALRPGSAQPVLTAAAAVLTAPAGRPGFAPTTALVRAAATNRLPAVVQALETALTRFDRQSELDEAEAKVARLAAEHRQVLAELEVAVGAADLGEVMRLRPRVEVELPVALDAARLAVAELQLARSEADEEGPARRLAEAADAVGAAERELEDARQRVQAASDALADAVADRRLAELVAGQAASQVLAARAERDRLAAANARSATDRLRRLAGLPDEPSTQRSEPAGQELEQMVRRDRVVTGRSEPFFVLGGGQRVAASELSAHDAEARADFERAKAAASSPVVTTPSEAESQHHANIRRARSDAEARAAYAASHGGRR